MKRFTFLSVFVLMIYMMPYESFAQSGTLVLFATPRTEANSLDAVITADQASATPHLVYELASVDTPYLFYGTVIINNDVTIRGKLGSNGRPPCIQPAVLSDNSIPGHLFSFTKPGAVTRISNLYLLGISIANSINWGDGMAISLSGENMKTYIDNVVFEQWGQFGINFSGQNNSFWITNCKFRNFVNNGSVYTGEAFRMRNDLGVSLVDTVIMKYNTFLAVNAYAQCSPVGGYAIYQEFSHNTIVSMVKNPFFLMNVTNWKCDHNIFYGTYVAGMANGEYPWWDRVWDPGVGATIDLDPLNKANAARFGIDTSAANWSALAEAARMIEVNDNIYFKPQSLTDFYTTWNATHTGTDSIYVTEWMNDVTINMFADNAKWPGLVADGNLVGTDPGYGSGIIDMIAASGTAPVEDGLGLIPYISAARANGGVANDIYGYQISAPDYSSGNWNPTWPLPEEASNDLKYTASLMATDGKQYGDPYWFTGTPTGVNSKQDLALSYKLNQNYPNPFNPSTMISFQLAKDGPVSLRIYDVTGREVLTVVDNVYKSSGTYNYNVNMSKLSSGTYFYTLNQNGNLIAKKMMLIK